MRPTPRTQIEHELSERQPGVTLPTWLTARQNESKSLRVIARELTTLTGIPISHESIRKWIREG